MKGILALTFSTLILSSYSFANEPNLDRGTAAVDEKYTDELKIRESALERKPQDNSVNSPLYHQESSQDRGAQKAVLEKQEEREGEPALEESEGTIWESENKKGQD